MRSQRIVTLVSMLIVLLSCTRAFAQQATITGLVTDETKAILPGVTITATNLATGTELTAVSDERGEFRLLNQIGRASCRERV